MVKLIKKIIYFCDSGKKEYYYKGFIKAPEDCYCYCFIEFLEYKTKWNGKKYDLKSEIINKSEFYFLKGRILEEKEIIENPEIQKKYLDLLDRFNDLKIIKYKDNFFLVKKDDELLFV